MLDRRSPVGPLAILLPHPTLPRRRSSLLSLATNASPRTPRSSGSPSCSSTLFFASAPNRSSTDSWNSSNHDLDDQEREWKPEHSLLLSRTLDALPAHIITPFNGIPPSNLLDKIARGVIQAKGPIEWPYSLRATRIKLLELARNRANEETAARKARRSTIFEEPSQEAAAPQSSPKHNRTPLGPENKRPLYRQSSMDFMNASNSDITTNDKLSRLSKRLQHADRIVSPTFHPYQHALRHRVDRSPSPSRILNPSTASSSTLNSSSSSSDSHRRMLRRSASTLATSNISKSPSCSPPQKSYLPPASPVISNVVRRTRTKRADSYSAPKRAHKRAPSFGAQAQEARVSSMDVDGAACHSSDEEEKRRSMQAKKPRTKHRAPTSPTTSGRSTVTPASLGVSATPIAQPLKPRNVSKSKMATIPDEGSCVNKLSKTSAVPTAIKAEKPRRNHKRNPSMFGAELPNIQHHPTQARLAEPLLTLSSSSPPTQPSSPVSPSLTCSTILTSPEPLSPSPSQNRTLRRVRRVDLGVGRKISFGNLAKCVEEDEIQKASAPAHPKEGSNILGSAFQLA